MPESSAVSSCQAKRLQRKVEMNYFTDR